MRKLPRKLITGSLVAASAIVMLSYQNCSKSAGSGGGDATADAVAGQPTPTPAPLKHSAYALGSNSFVTMFTGGKPHSVIDVIDLSTLTLSQSIDLGATAATAFAVDAANNRILVNNGTSNSMMIYQLDTGVFSKLLLTLTGVRKILMLPDHSKFLVLSSQGVSLMDPVTFALTSLALPASSDQAIDLAVSADGLFAASLTYSGSVSHVDLIDLKTMTSKGRASLSTKVSGCLAVGNHVVFGPTNVLLVSDSNCDSLHAILSPTMTELTALETLFGRDSSSGPGALVYSASKNIAISSKESLVGSNGSPGWGVVDLTANTSVLTPNPQGMALAGVLGIDDTTAIIASGSSNGNSSTVSQYDFSTGLMSTVAYTFSTPALSIVDLKVEAHK